MTSMLLLTILGLGFLTLINYRIVKEPFAPAVAFCGIWAIDLFLLWLVGDFFYPVGEKTLFIFLCGGLAFSLGSFLGLLGQRQPSAKEQQPLSPASNRLLNVLVIMVVCATPFAYQWIASLAATHQTNFFTAAYLTMLDETLQGGVGYRFFGNIVTLSMFVAMVAFFENKDAKWRARLTIFLAIILNLLTGGRTGFPLVVFSVLWLDWLKTRRIHWRLVAVLGVSLVVLLGALAIFLAKGDARPNASLADNIKPVSQGFVLYASGSMVAFDQVVKEPNIVPGNWPFYIFFIRIFKRFGANIALPEGSEFVHIGPNSLGTNTYSMYWSYLDLGFVGMMVAMVLIGLIATIIYRRALQGGTVASFLYAHVFYGIMLSPFAEFFLIPLYFILKLCAVVWFIYSAPDLWARFKALTGHAVSAELARHQNSSVRT